jgi:hypothetical protein
MSITNTALAQAMSDLIAHWQDFQDEHQAWLAGTVGGGPNSDGKYPLTDYLDVTTLVTCPAQLEEDVESLVAGAQGYADDAEASATAAAASAATATTQAGLAATARTNAETAETNAETAQAAAESARNTAIAQAAAAAASATAAQTAETNAETAETNAELAETNAEAAQALAEAAAASAAASAIEAASFDPDLFAGLSEDETITGNWSFTAAGAGDTSAAIRLASATPYIRYRESDQAADSTDWLLGASTMVFHIGPVTDAGTSPQAAQGIHLTRSGATVTEIQYDATAHDFNGTADFSSTVTINGVLTGPAGAIFTADATGEFLIRRSSSQYLDISSTAGGTVATAYSDTANAKSLIFRATTDSAGTVGSLETSIVLKGRANTTLAEFSDTEIELNGAMDFNGTLDLSGVAVFNSSGAGASSAIRMLSNNPTLTWEDANAASNEKVYDITADAGVLSFRTITDAYGAGSTWMMVDRSGTTVSEIELNATTFDLNGALDVSGNVVTAGLFSATQSANSAVVHGLGNSNAGASARIQMNMTSDAGALYFGATSTAFSPALLSSGPTGAHGYMATSGAYPLVFGTNNAARMTIGSTGTVTFAGTAQANGGFVAADVSVNGLFQGSNAAGYVYIGATTNHPLGILVNASNYYTFGGQSTWHVYGAGTLTTNASGVVSATSDERLKDILTPFTRGLDAITRINPIRYRWNNESQMGDDNEIYAGFSAQDVQRAIPEAVAVVPDRGHPHAGMLSLQDRPIIAALVNAIKELNERIEQLEAA